MKTKTKSTATTRKPAKDDYEFIARAERAFKIVARQVTAEAKLHGLKPLVWND